MVIAVLNENKIMEDWMVLLDGDIVSSRYNIVRTRNRSLFGDELRIYYVHVGIDVGVMQA